MWNTFTRLVCIKLKWIFLSMFLLLYYNRQYNHHKMKMMPLRLMISFAADFFRLLQEYALSPSSLVLGLIDIYSDCWMSGRCPPLAWCQACWSTWTPSGGRTPSTHSSQAQVYTGSKCSINPYRFLHAVFLDGLIEKVHICRIKIFIRMLKNNVLIPI